VRIGDGGNGTRPNLGENCRPWLAVRQKKSEKQLNFDAAGTDCMVNVLCDPVQYKHNEKVHGRLATPFVKLQKNANVL